MAQRYAIADWLTAAQKARAIAGRYTYHDASARRTRGGYCPLGRALWHPLRTPAGDEVATVLGRQHGGWTRKWWRDLCQAAYAFITAWDSGRIAPADLPTALGYAPAAPDPAARA